MREPDIDEESPRRPSHGGLRLRIIATALTLALAVFSAARFASASFDQAAVPVGDVASLDGIVSGTIHLTGGRLLIYSGDRFQSNESSLAVNLASGGSLILCPRSQLQILAANQSSGLMLAFQEGGTQQPFQLRANDVVMTPDWRIQMTGSVPAGEFGTLQLSTNRQGELCLSSNAKTGQFFRISELAGDSTFDVTGQSNIKIAGDRIENAPAGCSCQGAAPGSGPASIYRVSIEPGITSIPSAQSPPATAGTPPVIAGPEPQEGPHPAARKQKQRPQDLAGYVGSFIHLLFGR